ncbi:MAG: PTS sugar transporter subunit IIB [Lachnospiraceae bacterium]|nr:PTS sugar transporter subunit IIB [Lachnospiraceae bacterium]
MIKIRLFCESGMSTSILVQRMRDEAAKRGIEVDVKAFGKVAFDAETNGIDAALLAPQIGFQLDNFKKISEPKGVPTAAISMMDYGMMNGANVLDQVLGMIKK